MTFDEFEALKPGEYGSSCYGYKGLIRTFVEQIVIQVDDEDYQGDSRLLVTDKRGRFGILIFGWGSCSGCDAYQAAEGDVKELWNLRNSMLNDTKWFDTPLECLRYFENHDWEGDWCWSMEETKNFVKQGRDHFAELILLGDDDEN